MVYFIHLQMYGTGCLGFFNGFVIQIKWATWESLMELLMMSFEEDEVSDSPLPVLLIYY